jgi:hypothetical protein
MDAIGRCVPASATSSALQRAARRADVVFVVDAAPVDVRHEDRLIDL